MRAVGARTPEAARARLFAEVSAREAHRAAAAAAWIARSIEPGDALPDGAARTEIYQGEESAARRVIEVAGPIVKEAASWPALHAALAEHGIAYEAKGSGAIIIVDGIAVKASTCRAASRARLEKRLGAFLPRPNSVDTSSGSDRPNMAAIASSARPAPGTDPDLFALSQQELMAASTARSAYEATYPMLNFAPLLKATVVGPAPHAAPNARTLAKRSGKPLPRLAPMQRSTKSGTNVSGLLGRYHAALQADLYRVVAERPRLRDPDENDKGYGAESRPTDATDAPPDG